MNYRWAASSVVEDIRQNRAGPRVPRRPGGLVERDPRAAVAAASIKSMSACHGGEQRKAAAAKRATWARATERQRGNCTRGCEGRAIKE